MHRSLLGRGRATRGLKWFKLLGLAATIMMTLPAFAQLKAERTLRDLEEVGVAIGNLHPDAERRGLSQSLLQADLEQKLQDAGLQVLPQSEWEHIPGRPVLSLDVGIVPLDGFPVYSVTIKLQLRQHSCLTRNLIICGPTITWEDVGDTHTVSVARLTSLRQEVGNIIDRFISAYELENE